jgi:hypothetical protein
MKLAKVSDLIIVNLDPNSVDNNAHAHVVLHGLEFRVIATPVTERRPEQSGQERPGRDR